MGQAIGAIENALLDAKAKALGIPCHQLLGGRVRERVRVYWSHCGTWRVVYPQHFGNPVTDLVRVLANADALDDQLVESLSAAFDSDSPQVSQRLLTIFAGWNNPIQSMSFPSHKPLLENIVDHPSDAVRQRVAELLVGYPESEGLRSRVGDPAPRVRAALARSLGTRKVDVPHFGPESLHAQQLVRTLHPELDASAAVLAQQADRLCINCVRPRL